MEDKIYTSVDDIMCEYIDKRKSNKYIGEKQHWSASSLGSCKRLQTLQRINVPPSDSQPYKWKMLARDGDACHEWRQEVFKELGVSVMNEFSIKDEETNLYGRLDNVIMLNGVMTLIDIKTQGESAYKSRKGEVDPKHKQQLTAYFVFINKHKEKIKAEHNINIDIKDIRIYYINRNTGEREEFIINITEEDIKNLYLELQTLNDCWDKKIIPQTNKNFVFCKSVCQYRTICNKMPMNTFSRSQLNNYIV